MAVVPDTDDELTPEKCRAMLVGAAHKLMEFARDPRAMDLLTNLDDNNNSPFQSILTAVLIADFIVNPEDDDEE